MTYDYQVALAVLAIIIGIAGYGIYYYDIFKGKTKPHPFSWFVWGLMNVIVFFAQDTSNAGAGEWPTALVAVACLSISFVALFKGERGITKLDWACFFAALVGIVLWRITDQPLLAVIIVTITDAIAYIPTYRKAFYKPQEETTVSYALAALRSVFAIAALDSFALVNWLFPASLVLTDGGFALMLYVRRRQLAKRIGQDTMSRNG
ncbi:MAG: hypothetical protein AAB927_00460 [Patescibacteria group bacterium]